MWLLALSPAQLRAEVIVVEDDCLLVSAILAANRDAPVGGCPAGSGADEIQLTGDVEVFTVDNEVDGPNGLPSITSTIAMNGGGFVIERAEGAPDFRLFRIGGGVLELVDVEIRNGVTSEIGFDCDPGGGVFNVGGTLLVTRSSLIENESPCGLGGAIALDEGTAVIADSVITGSTQGPAIHNARGHVTVRNSSISGNSSAVNTYGGAATFLLLDSTVADHTDRALVNSRGGTLNVSHSTVTGTAGSGPSIVNSEGVLTLLNSTISGNDGGVENGGGYDYALTYVVHSTITENEDFGIDNNCPGFGCDPSEIRFILRDSIVSGNVGPDCKSSGDFEVIGVNFDSDGSCLDAEPLTNLDPNLADNGGLTLTHALLEGSPAIDAAGDCGLQIDQRGFGRSDGACDSGAFEFGAMAIEPELAIAGRCPGEVTLSLTGATPGGSVAIVRGVEPGVTIVPGSPCEGLGLEIADAGLVAGFVVDESGRKAIAISVPRGLCGTLLQAVDIDSCSAGPVSVLPR